ncbi:MAG: hypothetical protein NTX01_02330 [Candidatus Omnitrophica bacterium]|nr:hypothetical protein [Candidatus Omnitrophota bacterium]
MEDRKSNVILAPAQLHHFWTGGVYYLWELSKKYRVILIVDETYKNNVDFKKVIEAVNVLDVLYAPNRNIIKRHFCYANDFKRLVKKYQPQIIFHYEAIYSSMMYLYHWGNIVSPPSLRISYLTGMPAFFNFEQNFGSVIEHAVNVIAKKHCLPKGFCKFLFRARGWILFLLDYYILPFLFIRKFFYPSCSPFTFDRFKNNGNACFDYYLLYESFEKKATARIFGSEDRIREIQHPLKTVSDELHKVLYNFREENIVLILPSYGHIDVYQNETKKSDEEVIKLISLKWIEAISLLKFKFENYNFNWKLHPAQKQDYLWQEITIKVRRAYPDITLLPPDENAQKWILKSKVIVGEVSSVIWWSAFFETKITISLDIFGISLMDFFKNYEGVYYFDSLKSLTETDFINKCTCLSKSKRMLPTLSEFLEEVHK